MILQDFHMHTSFSADSDASMEEMIIQSINKGLKHISFTEHMDYDFPEKYNLFFEFDVDEYFNKVTKYKNKYNNDINIYYGIELGMQPNLGDRYNKLINNYPFDFVIASSHLIDKEDPYYPDYWSNTSIEAVYEKYLNDIYEIICEFNNFDVYGHIDYIVRYSPDTNIRMDYDKYKEIYDKIFSKLISMNKGIEFNCAGYKYGLGSPNPSKDILRAYKNAGGNIITFGSDAHKPEHIAYAYDEAKKLALDCGFEKYCVFKERKPEYIYL